MNEASLNDDAFKGLLSVQVKAAPVVAGTAATVSLIIRNPFPEAIIIESVQAPSSAPLLPERKDPSAGTEGEPLRRKPSSLLEKLGSLLTGIKIREVQFGPLVAKFPQPKSRSVYFNMEASSKLTIRAPFAPGEDIYINTAEGSEVIYDAPPPPAVSTLENPRSQRVIPPQQEDLASFELKTAHWLLVKPKVLELHALIRYKIGDKSRSQVVPVTISIQPPVKSIVLGSVSGGILGYVARQLNVGLAIESLPWGGMLIALLGIIVMATILAIVLSRQESSKGFVTIEDFYGAFVVGVVLGYTGAEYFEQVIGSGAESGHT